MKKLRQFKKKKGSKKRSSFEDTIAKQLAPYDAIYEGTSLPYITQKRYVVDFTVNVIRAGESVADNLIRLFNPIYIETKGWFRPSDRTKMLAVKKCNPDADIRLVFQSDNWLTKAHKRRYSDWAKEHGFPYAIGSVPKEWLE